MIADRCADRRVFGDAIDRAIGVNDGANVRFIDVGHSDHEDLSLGTGVGAGRSHRDAVAGGRFRVQSTVDSDHARCRVDREPPAGVIVQRIAHRVGRISVRCKRRDADGRSDRPRSQQRYWRLRQSR